MARARAVTVVRLAAAYAVLIAAPCRSSAQQVTENCTVSVLNRTVTANADGTWILPNVPANFGPVRARVTCLVNGQTISGESEPFVIPANGVVNIPRIVFGQSTPIPTALIVTASPSPLTQVGATAQVTVTARYPGGSTKDVTTEGTTYTVSNPAIAAVAGAGMVQAVSSGTVIIQASHEGASGMTTLGVALGGTDTDGDGIPDDVELSKGLNPNNPVDAQEDFDRDGLTNRDEVQRGTELRKADTDEDGLKDGDEIGRATNPLLWDTDSDGVSDGLEVQTGSNPLDPASYNLPAALTSLAIVPGMFTLTFNTIAGDVSVQLRVTGTMRDGRTIDVTSTQRGTNYTSSDLTICSFGAAPGRVFAGVTGACTVQATLGTFNPTASGTVTTFAPTPRSSVALGGPGNGVDVAGDYVYVAAGGAGLKVVDVSNRNAPHVAATLSLLGSANDVKLSGNRAFVAGGAAGLHIVDVANPLIPRLLASVDTPGDARDVAVFGDLVYVADGPAGLQVVDVSSGGTPRIVGSVLTDGANGVDIDASLAVVTTGGGGVRIVNVSNPANPVVLGAVATPGSALDVVANEGFAYVADYTGSIRAVDYRNPAAPQLRGTTPTSLGGILFDIAMMDSFVFGADIFFVNGVPIVDVSDPANLRPRAILNFPGDATGLGIAVDGSYVYLGTDNGQLYVGQYRIQQDLGGVPPTVTISSPANGSTFVRGETINVTVTATDDLAVAGVSLRVDGNLVGTDTTAPYKFSVSAPTNGSSSIIVGAEAVDLGNNTGVAADVEVQVIPDPLTTVEGRVLLNGLPRIGASVTCAGAGTVTIGDGTFSLAGVPTVQPVIVCSVRFVADDGVVFGAVTSPAVAVRGGITNVGDIAVAPVPIIESILPRVFDATRPPSSVSVSGSNLSGSTFSFVPQLIPPPIAANSAQVDPAGTAATLTISVSPTGRGRFTLVATNALGAGSDTPTSGNTVTLVNAADDVDTDGDGFPDGLELLFGSDPGLATSTPNLTTTGNVQGQNVAVLNRLFPSTLVSVRESQSMWVSVANRLFPSTLVTTRESQSMWVSVVNRLFPSTLPSVRESQSMSVSVVNRLFPSTLVTTREAQSNWVAVLNRSFSLGTPTLFEAKSHWFSLLNSTTGPQTPSPSIARNQQAESFAAGQAAAALSLDLSPSGETLVQGQTILVRAESSNVDLRSVTLTVNGATIETMAEAPFVWLFTVPAGTQSLEFSAGGSDASGTRIEAAPVTRTVIADPTIMLSGTVVDQAGNAVAGAVVEVVSEGVDAEFFELSAPAADLPDLNGRTPTRTTRLTAINMRNPDQMFGDDPLASGLVPHYAGRLTGWLVINEAGSHTFILGASDAARLKVGGEVVLQTQGGTGDYGESLGSVALSAGLVPFELVFVQSLGSGELDLSAVTPEGMRRPVTPSVLVPAGRVFNGKTDSDGRFVVSGVPTALGSVQLRAVTTAGDRGVSRILVPTPNVDTNVGTVVIQIPQR